jgi:hypothetical protein
MFALCALTFTPAVATETYAEYVLRSLDQPSAALEAALAAAGQSAIQAEDVELLVSANSAYLDASYSDGDGLPRPSSDARICVPLLVQLVREWSAHGEAQRNQTFSPLVTALESRLATLRSPRVLVHGSGLGRLVYDLAEALIATDPQLVAVEPDVHAQLLARRLLDPNGDDHVDDIDDIDDDTRCGSATHGIGSIYPSVHVPTGWANTTDRLKAVRVPDVSRTRRRAVDEGASVQLVVGKFPQSVTQGESGSSDLAVTGFDAVATSFFIDVAADALDVLRAFHRLLLVRSGYWSNLGPVAYPDAPNEALGGANTAFVLTLSQLLALVRHAGFEVLEQRLLACEYGGLPARLERTERTCLFFVARAV